MGRICDCCKQEVDFDYPPRCPNCGRCFHYEIFGSDIQCPNCKQMHYWFGFGWKKEDEPWEAYYTDPIKMKFGCTHMGILSVQGRERGLGEKHGRCVLYNKRKL